MYIFHRMCSGVSASLDKCRYLWKRGYSQKIEEEFGSGVEEFGEIMYEQHILYEQEKEKQLLEELSDKVPYEGLSEKYMHQTKLGAAKVDKNWNRYSINNKHYLTNRYAYYRDGIKAASCIKAFGRV